jgi:hypothetical protein
MYSTGEPTGNSPKVLDVTTPWKENQIGTAWTEFAKTKARIMKGMRSGIIGAPGLGNQTQSGGKG